MEISRPSVEQMLAAVADSLALPMLALQRDGVLLHANRAGHHALVSGQPLRLLASGQVQPHLPAQATAFGQALRQAVAGRRTPWTWSEHPAPQRAWISALGADAADPVLLLLPPPAGLALDVSGFAAAHGLTPAETRVLQQLALGCSPRQAAAALRLGLATVRSHLLNIRRKSGHADLQALAAALAALPPLLLAEPGDKPV